MTEDFPSLLANERTLLAYASTALTCLLTGIGLIKLFGSPLIIGLGVGLLPIGAAVLGVGLWRFRAVGSAIATSGHGMARWTGGHGSRLMRQSSPSWVLGL
ncbi:MAG: DUF202 domain-containing protein [Pseudomonadota bacterium]|nr:DUF202 domain-containing protein [Pseudomonadota bacterium]